MATKGKSWKIRIWVDQTWIDDGFDLNSPIEGVREDWFEAIQGALLPYAHDYEVKIKIVR